MIKDTVLKLLQDAVVKTGIEESNIPLSHPANPEHGDFATSIALKHAKNRGVNPAELAEQIANHIDKKDLIETVEVVKPGFINISLTKKTLLDELNKISDLYARGEKKSKKYIVEFAHPNTHKLFHIGHLLNITIGESLVRILEYDGIEVIRANYQGDVGLHIAKTLWRLKQMKEHDETHDVFTHKDVTKRISLIGRAYTEGNKAYEEDEKAKAEITTINHKIFNQDKEILELWNETRQWSLDYFDEIYKRVGTHYDRLFFEHEFAHDAVKIVNEALDKGILEKSEGAVVFNGKQYGLDTRVFLNSLGLPTYEGKEVALARKEFTEFGTIDRCIHVVGPEQSSFFKVTFKVEELLDPDTFKGKQYHLAYGWVRLKAGKMSSRKGNVVEGVWLLDEAKKEISAKYNTPPDIAEKLAVASVKYSFLKSDITKDVIFDFSESISMEGNSGPYLIYTYVRTQSILRQTNGNNNDFSLNDVLGGEVNPEEKAILGLLYQFPEVIEAAAKQYAPSLIATYLFSLAQSYNLFYQKHQVLKADAKQKALRISLTAAVGKILKSGLNLLGIETVEKM